MDWYSDPSATGREAWSAQNLKEVGLSTRMEVKLVLIDWTI